MLKSWIKKQVGEALEDTLNPPSKLESRAVERAMEGSAPAVIAFRIKNGFLLRNNVIPPNGLISAPVQTEFVYCADAQALGDAIVSAHVRDRMQESNRPRSMETIGFPEQAMPTGPAVNRI